MNNLCPPRSTAPACCAASTSRTTAIGGWWPNTLSAPGTESSCGTSDGDALRVKLLCIANSWRPDGRCVAGIDLTTGARAAQFRCGPADQPGQTVDRAGQNPAADLLQAR